MAKGSRHHGVRAITINANISELHRQAVDEYVELTGSSISEFIRKSVEELPTYKKAVKEKMIEAGVDPDLLDDQD